VDFEQVLHPIFQEDELTLIVAGGALGLLAGLLQDLWGKAQAAKKARASAGEGNTAYPNASQALTAPYSVSSALASPALGAAGAAGLGVLARPGEVGGSTPGGAGGKAGEENSRLSTEKTSSETSDAVSEETEEWVWEMLGVDGAKGVKTKQGLEDALIKKLQEEGKVIRVSEREDGAGEDDESWRED